MSRARDLADRVLHNRTHEDTEGGRESIVTFKGEQSGGEISTLAQIQASHDGTSDDEKADLIFKTNDGSNGASPTERVRIDSEGNLGLGSSSPTTYVDGSAGSTLVLESSGTDRGALVFASECTGGANEILGLINFTDTANTTSNKRSAAIRGHRGSGDANAYLTFTTDNTERMRIDSDGNVTMPLQPSFMVQLSTIQTNIAINGTRTVLFDTERFDVGGNFSSNTFTAPVTGKYQLNVELRLDSVDSGATYYHLYLITSNRTYHTIMDPNFTFDLSYHSISTSVLTDMDANDTAYVAIYQAAGNAQTDLNQDSNFSGILIG